MTSRLITLLLLAHVAVAFWAFGPAHVQNAVWPTPGQSDREPERVALQRRPEAMVLVPAASPTPIQSVQGQGRQPQPEQPPKP